MKASIVFFPNESKKNQKTSKIPLYMRIGFKNAKAESRLNAEISQTELSKWDPIIMRMAERGQRNDTYFKKENEGKDKNVREVRSMLDSWSGKMISINVLFT